MVAWAGGSCPSYMVLELNSASAPQAWMFQFMDGKIRDTLTNPFPECNNATDDAFVELYL